MSHHVKRCVFSPDLPLDLVVRYNEKKREISKSYFRLASNRYNNDFTILMLKEIDLTAEIPPEAGKIGDETCDTFLDFVMRAPINVTLENACGLYIIAKFWEVTQLEDFINQFIKNENNIDVLVTHLIHIKYFGGDSHEFEEKIAQNLEYLFDSPNISMIQSESLYRIFQYAYTYGEFPHSKFWNFLQSLLKERKQDFLLFIQFLDFSKISLEQYKEILECDIPEFIFVNKSYFTKVFGLYELNLQMTSEITEIQNNLEKYKVLLLNFGKIKEEYNNMYINLKNEFEEKKRSLIEKYRELPEKVDNLTLQVIQLKNENIALNNKYGNDELQKALISKDNDIVIERLRKLESFVSDSILFNDYTKVQLLKLLDYFGDKNAGEELKNIDLNGIDQIEFTIDRHVKDAEKKNESAYICAKYYERKNKLELKEHYLQLAARMGHPKAIVKYIDDFVIKQGSIEECFTWLPLLIKNMQENGTINGSNSVLARIIQKLDNIPLYEVFGRLCGFKVFPENINTEVISQFSKGFQVITCLYNDLEVKLNEKSFYTYIVNMRFYVLFFSEYFHVKDRFHELNFLYKKIIRLMNKKAEAKEEEEAEAEEDAKKQKETKEEELDTKTLLAEVLIQFENYYQGFDDLKLVPSIARDRANKGWDFEKSDIDRIIDKSTDLSDEDFVKWFSGILNNILYLALKARNVGEKYIFYYSIITITRHIIIQKWHIDKSIKFRICTLNDKTNENDYAELEKIVLEKGNEPYNLSFKQYTILIDHLLDETINEGQSKAIVMLAKFRYYFKATKFDNPKIFFEKISQREIYSGKKAIVQLAYTKFLDNIYNKNSGSSNKQQKIPDKQPILNEILGQIKDAYSLDPNNPDVLPILLKFLLKFYQSKRDLYKDKNYYKNNEASLKEDNDFCDNLFDFLQDIIQLTHKEIIDSKSSSGGKLSYKINSIHSIYSGNKEYNNKNQVNVMDMAQLKSGLILNRLKTMILKMFVHFIDDTLHTSAMKYYMNGLYYSEFGKTKKESHKAINFFKKAAQHGKKSALLHCGICYERTEPTAANYYYELSSRHGNSKSMYKWAIMYIRREKSLFFSAAYLQEKAGCYYHADIQRKSLLNDMAIAYYLRAGSLGHYRSYYDLGKMVHDIEIKDQLRRISCRWIPFYAQSIRFEWNGEKGKSFDDELLKYIMNNNLVGTTFAAIIEISVYCMNKAVPMGGTFNKEFDNAVSKLHEIAEREFSSYSSESDNYRSILSLYNQLHGNLASYQKSRYAILNPVVEPKPSVKS